MATSVQVSWIQFTVPDHAPDLGNPVNPLGGCGCGCACNACAVKPNGPKAPGASGGPIRYGTGEIVLSATDLSTGGFGFPWGHTRSFASRLSQPTNVGNGFNWQVQEWPYLVRPGRRHRRRHGRRQRRPLVRPRRQRLRPALRRHPDPALSTPPPTSTSSSTWTAASPSSTARPAPSRASATRPATRWLSSRTRATTATSPRCSAAYTAGGVTTTESFLYTYVDSTQPYPLLSGVLLRRQVGQRRLDQRGAGAVHLLRPRASAYGEPERPARRW